MKIKYGLAAILIAGVGCKINMKLVDENRKALEGHSPPYTIFSVGYYDRHYMILTLKDHNQDYVTIRVILDERLKIGQSYSP